MPLSAGSLPSVFRYYLSARSSNSFTTSCLQSNGMILPQFLYRKSTVSISWIILVCYRHLASYQQVIHKLYISFEAMITHVVA